MLKDEIQPRIPMTVQEMPGFAKEADRILGDARRIQLLTFLGLNPTAGAKCKVPEEFESCAGQFRGGESEGARG
jgi:hypothetical protein